MERKKMEKLSINVPTKKVNGNTTIDVDFMLYLLKHLNGDEEKTNHQAAIVESLAKDFKEQVRLIWSDCLATGPKPWQNKDNIIGEALNVDYTFDPDKIALHAEEIYHLIAMVQTATTYEEMKFLSNGEKWSELRQPVSFLMALGNSLKLVDFKNKRADWTKEEELNPEIQFKLQR